MSQKRYSAEFKERAIRLVVEGQKAGDTPHLPGPRSPRISDCRTGRGRGQAPVLGRTLIPGLPPGQAGYLADHRQRSGEAWRSRPGRRLRAPA